MGVWLERVYFLGRRSIGQLDLAMAQGKGTQEHCCAFSQLEKNRTMKISMPYALNLHTGTWAGAAGAG